MTVSRRNTFIAGAGTLALAALGSLAFAGGGTGGSGKGPGAGVVVPGAGVNSGPAMGFGAGAGNGSSCCKGMPKGQSVIVPGVNVAGPNIVVNQGSFTVNQGSVITNTQTFLNTNVIAGGNDQGFFVSGGGGFFAPQGVAPSQIGALNVEGNTETFTETITEQVPTTEEFCEDQISVQTALRPVQAVCLDDKGTPHPASQVTGAQRLAATYNGEVFRCMAGTSMQVTLGKIENGGASFAHGETFACDKGEALIHLAGGKLSCAPQTPQRSCNERSLLRRHGPGLKIVETHVQTKTCIPRTRTVMKSVQREVERVRQAKGMPMVFDGGVGQGVN
ncbi:MAG: hypothetical protein AAGF20_05000 [Pseudomonadota bacterium]